MLVMLSFSNTSRARSWFFAFCTSASVTPSVRTRSISASVASSSCWSDVPSVAVNEIVYMNGCSVGTRPPVTDEASPVLTSAR